MEKKTKKRLYAIVDATDVCAVNVLKGVLSPYSPKYREGKTVVVGGFNKVLFVEFSKREGPIFDIMKNLANTYKFYPFYVIEEHKSTQPKRDKYENALNYHIVEAALADVKVEDFDGWLDNTRAVAKAIYLDDSVFLKLHAYYRKEDGTAHVILANTENTTRQAPSEQVVLGENGWKEAVQKLASLMNFDVEFKKVRYKNL